MGHVLPLPGVPPQGFPHGQPYPPGLSSASTKRDGDNYLFTNNETFNVGNIHDEYIHAYNDRTDDNGEYISVYNDRPDDNGDKETLNPNPQPSTNPKNLTP